MKIKSFLFLLSIPLLSAGCMGQAASIDKNIGKLKVVATTTLLGDLAGKIGGENIELQTLMGPGIDPHLYQASAGDVIRMQNANVVVYNGLHLEGKMGEIFASLVQRQTVVICITDGMDSSALLSTEENPRMYDPHIWFDVSLWKQGAIYLAERFSEADPTNMENYSANLQTYLAELDQLDAYIRQKTEEVPDSQRILVTAHDAFRYFGKAYGFQVKGLQGISTAGEAGTADISRLAQFILENQINAVFIESSVSPKTINALQAATGAKGVTIELGGSLYSDSLGGKDSGAETYILTFQANIDTIVHALK